MSVNDKENLIWSIKNGDLETVMKFVDANPKVVKELVKNRTYLHYACDYGQKEIIEYLVKKGADVNVQDGYRIAPLLAAIWEDHETCVELLLKLGANKTCKSPDGKTYADCTENTRLKKLLS